MKTQALKNRGGFALIVCISLLLLMAVILVGFLSFGAAAVRSATHQSAESVAKANARMALMVAIGQLQKEAGPDQRVTASGGLAAEGTSGEGWTGAWDAEVDGGDPTWLVSGEAPNPAATWDEGNSALLSTGVSGLDGAAGLDLRAPGVVGDDLEGRYAYWIGDEGVKARVDLALDEAGDTEKERLQKGRSAQQFGLAYLDEAVWGEFAHDGTAEPGKLGTMGTASLAVGEGGGVTRESFGRHYFHDLTTGGYGLPVNVKEGGLRVDLSTIFDSDHFVNKEFGRHYFGVTSRVLGSHPINDDGAKVYGFITESASNLSAADREKFFLSESLTKNFTVETGPNWGILWNYARMWENVDGQEAQAVAQYPIIHTPLRTDDWAPYTQYGNISHRMDRQHATSSLNPVLAVFQMGFRMGAYESEAQEGDEPGKRYFYTTLEFKPLLGIWNPYNVAIKAQQYKFDWALYPYFRFGHKEPPILTNPTGGGNGEVYLREYWVSKTSDDGLPTPSNPNGSSWFRMKTQAVDLQPGEIRIFSIDEEADITSENNYLKPVWGERGVYVFDLINNTTKKKMRIPEGHVGWYGDVFLQDSHWRTFTSKFPNMHPDATASWLTFKATSRSGREIFLSRHSGLWNGGTDASMGRPFMPEQIITRYGHGPDGTTKQLMRVEDMAAVDAKYHIGTWSFTNRTTQVAEEGSQGLRNWIDTNPRTLVGLPKYDGSKVLGSGNVSGWHTTGPFVAGSHETGSSRGEVGDGDWSRSPHRGLIGEGALGEESVEIDVSEPGRPRAFGGPSTSAGGGGQTHVVVYDVPRAPLQSIGQFQHAELGRYSFDPGFVLGNSYASLRIPTDQTVAPNFMGYGDGFDMVDISYEVNERVWDGYYFSTLAGDYYDGPFDLADFVEGGRLPANPRLQFRAQSGDESFAQILAEAGERGPEAMTGRVMVKGAFNVNSTSKTAWKALLASMADRELPVLNLANGSASWERVEGIHFNRFGHLPGDEGFDGAVSVHDPAFWRGWRHLSEDELDELAEEIVTEVKARGPFRSLADFVNRDPEGTKAQQRKGALQAALDRVANSKIGSDTAAPASTPSGAAFSDAVDGESQGVGYAGYLLQGDVLQSLAPVLQVRSDYFRIRTCGEAHDAEGKVLARAWCEAYVQRVPEYLDAGDEIYEKEDELAPGGVNETFGRRFAVVSFRWLSPEEI
ncbi:MAG: hypothetical protein ACQKBY_09615 [Verrucomicrobiales bacterium]